MRTKTSHRGWWVALQVLICCNVLIIVTFISIISVAIAVPLERDGLQSLNKVFRGFFVTLPEIKGMGFFAAGVAVDLDQLAASFAGQLCGMFFQLSANALATGCFVDGKVADSGEVAFQRDLGDEMEGEKTQDGDAWGGGDRVGSGIILPHEQHFCRIIEQPGKAVFQKFPGIRIVQLIQQPDYPGPIGI